MTCSWSGARPCRRPRRNDWTCSGQKPLLPVRQAFQALAEATGAVRTVKRKPRGSLTWLAQGLRRCSCEPRSLAAVRAFMGTCSCPLRLSHATKRGMCSPAPAIRDLRAHSPRMQLAGAPSSLTFALLWSKPSLISAGWPAPRAPARAIATTGIVAALSTASPACVRLCCRFLVRRAGAENTLPDPDNLLW
jgi:hypothetical protein